MMLALRLTHAQPIEQHPLEPIELPLPQPQHDEIRVRVRACAVCHTDLHVVEGDIPHPTLPIVPGHQIAGVNVVRDLDYHQAKPAWVSYDNTRRIDCMSIAVSDGPKDLKLIRVAAQFEVERLDKVLPLPAIIISAITCEQKV